MFLNLASMAPDEDFSSLTLGAEIEFAEQVDPVNGTHAVAISPLGDTRPSNGRRAEKSMTGKAAS